MRRSRKKIQHYSASPGLENTLPKKRIRKIIQ